MTVNKIARKLEKFGLDLMYVLTYISVTYPSVNIKKIVWKYPTYMLNITFTSSAQALAHILF